MVEGALLAYNFTAGMLAFFSPCGFPMLPAYLAYYLPRGGGARGAGPFVRGLGGGGLAAAGAFSALLGIGGLAVLLGAPFKQRVAWLELAGGLLVMGLGVLVLAGRGPSVKVGIQPSQSRSALSLVGFGALYAAVASSCVAPILLSVLVQAFAAPTAWEGLLHVGAYAGGLSLLLLGTTVLVTGAQHALLGRVKRILPHVERASGVVLVLVGLYLVGYWARTEGLLG